jgi:hypothetical protein
MVSRDFSGVLYNVEVEESGVMELESFVTDLAGFTEPGKNRDKETIGKIKRIFQRFPKAQERSATREQAMRCQEDSKVSRTRSSWEMPSRFKLETTGTRSRYLYVSKRCTDHGLCRDKKYHGFLSYKRGKHVRISRR